MFKTQLKNILTERGFLLTTVLAFACLLFFFGKLLQHPNEIYFGSSDDGMQSYYNAIYHVKHDTSYWRMNGMNYPYGEQVFFTGCQPFITNPIKLISNVVDISDYTVGILNCIMLFSIFFCALCLYLIFKHLRLPAVYSAIAAVGISFLSPQLARLAYHYSLTYQFAIPLFLLLMLKFYEAPTIKKTILIGLLVFFMAGTHFYFFGFFALISVFCWVILYFRKNVPFNNLKFVALHAGIQIVVPFFIFKCIGFFTDFINDRTNNPWGFTTYLSNLAGVFYPTGWPYKSIYATFIDPEYPLTVEGNSFVGFIATIVFLIMFVIFLKRVVFFKFRDAFRITDQPVITIFGWTAVFALVLSFGIPFKFPKYTHLLDYLGLVKQMRGMGRFAWTFYYIMNIIAFYMLYKWFENKASVLKKTVLTIALAIISYDAYYMASPLQTFLNNRVSGLEDEQNMLEENRWLNEVNPDDYQAIITLPYLHVGSENIWMIRPSAIINGVYITSIKTGLPTVSSVMSRTSLSQTYKNLSIIWEPYRKLEILNDLKSRKPFLVLAIEKELNEDEKRLLGICKKIKESPVFNIYELSYDALEHISDSLYSNTLSDFKAHKTYDVDGFRYTDSVKTFVYNSYDKRFNLNKSDSSYFLGNMSAWGAMFHDTVPNFKYEQQYTVSFWIDDFTKDLYPRISCAIECFDSAGVSRKLNEFGLLHGIRLLDGSRGLIEGSIVVKSKHDRIAVSFWHYDVFDKKKRFKIRELIIKPSNEKIFKYNGKEDSIMYNNRVFIKPDKLL